MRHLRALVSISIAGALVVAVSVVAAPATTTSSSEFVLVENGSPRTRIVVPRDASDAEKHAARLLQDRLRAMSAAELPVQAVDAWPCAQAVNVGKITRLAKSQGEVGEDDVFCRFEDGGLLIAGGGDRGVLYAAITFLEHLGCDWPMPGDENKIVPPQRKVAVSTQLGIAERPAFKYRSLHAVGGMGAISN